MSAPHEHTAFDVVAIGNAIVDVIASAGDDLLSELGLEKGSMTLVDEDRAEELYRRMGPGVEISGGSAANTAVGVASFGGRAAFTGRVADDQLGEVFGHDIRAAGVHYDTKPALAGPSTARCLILVTPDAQRTMNTFLGASTDLAPADLDAEAVRGAAVTFLEGYLWDPPQAKDAYRAAIELARSAGRQVAFSLSDTFCVERHRHEFLALLDGEVDIVFANEAEACSLFQVSDLDAAAAALAERVAVGVVTCSERGAEVLAAGERIHVDAHPAEAVVDTTGAGDLFAAGFLFGHVRGRDPETCGRLGALAAAEVIAHTGGRPSRVLAELAAEAGLG